MQAPGAARRYKRNPGQARARAELLTKPYRYCLIYGGSRSGKTFELTGSVVERALNAPGSSHLIVRQEAISAKRAIVHDTFPDLMRLRWPNLKWKWNEKLGFIKLQNDSIIWIGGINDREAMERILGMEFSTIYINEASEVAYAAFPLLQTRLAAQAETVKGHILGQRMYVDLNPTVQQHWTYQLWHLGIDPETRLYIDRTQYGYITVNPEDNAENLSPEYLKALRSMSPDKRRRFYEGAYGADDPDALWRRTMIRRAPEPPEMSRIIVAIDPAISSEPGSDETGIVVAGLGFDGIAYILEDLSGKYRPEDWSKVAVGAYDGWQADRIIAEKNQGGAMVESTIRTVRADVPFRAVTATRSKQTRAEPAAALYERGKVLHVGEFVQLEDQMCAFKPDIDRKRAGYSPDRVDALVWALTDLFPGIVRRKKEAVARAIPTFSAFGRAA